MFLEDVARLAAQVTPQTSCGITMRRDGEPVTIAATDERARTLDETQYAVGYGPCLHSLEVGQVRDTELRADLEQALSSRSVIDQALGIIMGQQRCAADQAFDLLRRRSQSGNRRLRDVAAQLVTSTTGGPPQLGRPFQP